MWDGKPRPQTRPSRWVWNIGGCDIIREIAETGELEGLLADKGVPHQPIA